MPYFPMDEDDYTPPKRTSKHSRARKQRQRGRK